MRKAAKGFQTGLLSFTTMGTGRRASVVVALCLAGVVMSSIHLIGSMLQFQVLTTEIVLSASLLVGFIVYDLLYQQIVKHYPAQALWDRLILFGSQAVLIGLILPIILLGWVIVYPVGTAIALAAGLLWLVLISGTLLLVRFAYGLLFVPVRSNRQKTRRR